MSQNGQSAHLGSIVEIKGVVIDAVFPERDAVHLQRARDRRARHRRRDVLASAGGGGAAAPGRRPRPRDRDGRDRRALARARGQGHGWADHRPGRRGDAGPHLQRARRDDRQRRPGRDRGALADPPPGARLRVAVADHRDLRDRDQGDRPARPVRQGRQGRPVRRRRRGQDGADHGADQQHRPGARRPVGVRGRGGAHPRGQRPLPGDEGVRGHLEDRAHVRADERAARSAPARRALAA